jgi:hypothetical protein
MYCLQKYCQQVCCYREKPVRHNIDIITDSGYSDFALKNTTASISQNSFFEQPPPSSSARLTQHQAPDEDDWDRTYANQNEYDGQDALGVPHSNDIHRRPSDMLRTLADFSPTKEGSLDMQEDPLNDYWEDEDEEDETRFVNFSLLSHIAMQLRDKVPRGVHVKGSIPYPRAFTGKDIVVRQKFYAYFDCMNK